MSSLWEKHQVFVVLADNGEDYEDYSVTRLGIFYKKEDAELYLRNAGWKWSDKDHQPRWTKVLKGFFDDVTCSAWIEEDYVSF